MSKFTDKNGMEWNVELDGWSVSKIQKDTGFDILEEGGNGLLQICARGDLLTNALWVLCEDEAKERDMTPKKFGRAMVKSEVIVEARKALQEAVLDFFPPNQKAALTSVIQSQREIDKSRIELQTARVEDPKLRKEIVDAMETGMDEFLKETLKELRSIRSQSSATSSPDTSDAAPEE